MFMWVMALCEKRGAWPTSENECATVAHSTATQAKVGVPRDRIRHDGLASHAIGFVTTGWCPTRSDSSRRVGDDAIGVPYQAGDHDGLASHAIGLYTSDRGLHMPRARRPPSRLSRTGPLAMPM